MYNASLKSALGCTISVYHEIAPKSLKFQEKTYNVKLLNRKLLSAEYGIFQEKCIIIKLQITLVPKYSTRINNY